MCACCSISFLRCSATCPSFSCCLVLLDKVGVLVREMRVMRRVPLVQAGLLLRRQRQTLDAQTPCTPPGVKAVPMRPLLPALAEVGISEQLIVTLQLVLDLFVVHSLLGGELVLRRVRSLVFLLHNYSRLVKLITGGLGVLLLQSPLLLLLQLGLALPFLLRAERISAVILCCSLCSSSSQVVTGHVVRKPHRVSIYGVASNRTNASQLPDVVWEKAHAHSVLLKSKR
jgi:hypothetical protein